MRAYFFFNSYKWFLTLVSGFRLPKAQKPLSEYQKKFKNNSKLNNDWVCLIWDEVDNSERIKPIRQLELLSRARELQLNNCKTTRANMYNWA